MSIMVGPKFFRVQAELETNVGHISSSGLNRGTEGWSPRVIKPNWMQESLDLLICMGARHWITCQRASHCSTMQLCHCLLAPPASKQASFQYQWVPAADNTSLPFCQPIFCSSLRISNCSTSALWGSSWCSSEKKWHKRRSCFITNNYVKKLLLNQGPGKWFLNAQKSFLLLEVLQLRLNLHLFQLRICIEFVTSSGR